MCCGLSAASFTEFERAVVLAAFMRRELDGDRASTAVRGECLARAGGHVERRSGCRRRREGNRRRTVINQRDTWAELTASGDTGLRLTDFGIFNFGARPLPFSVIVRTPNSALLFNCNCPVRLPFAIGSNATPIVHEPPAAFRRAIVRGHDEATSPSTAPTSVTGRCGVGHRYLCRLALMTDDLARKRERRRVGIERREDRARRGGRRGRNGGRRRALGVGVPVASAGRGGRRRVTRRGRDARGWRRRHSAVAVAVVVAVGVGVGVLFHWGTIRRRRVVSAFPHKPSRWLPSAL